MKPVSDSKTRTSVKTLLETLATVTVILVELPGGTGFRYLFASRKIKGKGIHYMVIYGIAFFSLFFN
ncbi:hypothetical protein MKY48_15635 [Paenibacillus sp. FSL W8-0187]|uniref:hypothetical protein n=1 Tax=Paenibacillus sp. FSL W8-0187 TaxID=2921710 RepID=UPI0030DC4A41